MLVAFFLAALAKFVSIILGYLGDSLLRFLLSIMDDAAIRAYRKTLIARKGVPAIVRFWLSIKGLFSRCARRDPPHLQPALTRERRVEVITRFLLGFSDQKSSRAWRFGEPPLSIALGSHFTSSEWSSPSHGFLPRHTLQLFEFYASTYLTIQWSETGGC